MNKVKTVLLSAGISLALSFTFGCSSGGGGGESSEQSYKYCITADGCLPGPFTTSTCRGQLSNGCPNGSSPSVGGSSSSKGGGGFSSSSSSVSGQGVPFNENSQIYNGYYDENDVYHIGSAYKDSGVIKLVAYEEDDNEVLINAGSVTNGIVKLNLPTNIPNEYLEPYLDEDEQKYCTDYPKNIKVFGGIFVLTNSNGDYIGRLGILYKDKQIMEMVYYFYFSKAGKITCKFDGEEMDIGYSEIVNINAKLGWNRIYVNTNHAEETHKYNTDNILTKEVKWILEQR